MTQSTSTTPTIGVTAATGQLGQLVVAALLRRGVPADHIVAIVRTPSKAADLAAQGVTVRQADYHQPQSLQTALQGVQNLLLISSNDFQDRPGQHRNVIEAAREAGVQRVAYTSILNADTSTMLLAADHQATEQALRASGVTYTLLRNGWYSENYTGSAAQTVQNGVLLGSAGEGALNPAAREDYADAAAVVLSAPGHDNATYELAGDTALTLPQIAAEYAARSGRSVEYRDLPEQAYADTLKSYGLPEALAAVFANSDSGIARGELGTDRRDLSTLIGRPTTPFGDTAATALQG
ncbi:SDR family oxidoreductase [Deinococcus aquiradiocola]|uniref:NAD(P)-dependent oxidoreductase n=1 Tax=Deinococcus aquiradiocola TaxID=393059 RepID=A0A917P4Q0_9DEIO|nr:SDR family oxidoreductase [Deinococcus aquiradiocola]GGJ61613.1 NAD(P)-dependent oxidoreductase [Deinococcus aquiradiocola]